MTRTAQPHPRAIGKLKMKNPLKENNPWAYAGNGRKEQSMLDLERLQKDANGIVNTYVDYVAARTGNSFTATKAAIIFPLGSQINFPAALRLVHDELVKSLRPWGRT